MTNTDKIVISGIGAISPAGLGKESLLKAFQDNISGIKKITKFSAPPARPVAGEISDSMYEEYRDKLFRRIADISKYAIIAAKSAIDDARIEMKRYIPERIGLIICITHGALGYSSAFHKDLLNEGPQAASPLLFSDSVLNAPAGNLSNYFVIRGPVHTLIGGSVVSVEAIRLAEELLNSNRVDCCLVGAAEELNEIVFHTYVRFGFEFPVGEGAGMFILERQKDVLGRGQKAYCMLKGNAARFSYKDSMEDSLVWTINKCLSRAGISMEDITDIFVNSIEGENALEKIFIAAQKKPQIKDITHLLGEAFCVTTIFHIIISAMMLYDDLNTRNVLINASSIEGSTASLIISKVME